MEHSIPLVHDGFFWFASVNMPNLGLVGKGLTKADALRSLADQFDAVAGKVAKASERGLGTVPDSSLGSKTGANAVQVGGTHYKAMAIEHWDWVAANGLDYFQGNITKYVARWKLKDGIKDLEKAQHYLQKYIELEKARMGSIKAECVLPKD